MPAHAQRMNSLLASDKENALCKSKEGIYDARRGADRVAGAGRGGNGGSSVHGEGPTEESLRSAEPRPYDAGRAVGFEAAEAAQVACREGLDWIRGN